MADNAGVVEVPWRARDPVVLLVEPEPLLRGTTAEYLRLSNCAVLEISQATQAMALADSGTPIDVVFSEVYVRGPFDGLALVRWLQQRHPQVAVLLTTGHGGGAIQAAVELVGEEAFLAKPNHQDELERRIRLMTTISRFFRLPPAAYGLSWRAGKHR
jgi:DNA-binding NtrC family response regulator